MQVNNDLETKLCDSLWYKSMCRSLRHHSGSWSDSWSAAGPLYGGVLLCGRSCWLTGRGLVERGSTSCGILSLDAEDARNTRGAESMLGEQEESSTSASAAEDLAHGEDLLDEEAWIAGGEACSSLSSTGRFDEFVIAK